MSDERKRKKKQGEPIRAGNMAVAVSDPGTGKDMGTAGHTDSVSEDNGSYLNTIRHRLFSMQDTGYQIFHRRLVPTVPPEKIIGVRTPHLRSYAKELMRNAKSDSLTAEMINAFMENLPHEYYEENTLHGFLIEQIGDYDRCIACLDRFLPYVDNWATCDMMRPRIFSNHKDRLLEKICEWMSSSHTYMVRFGIGMLMRWYLDDEYSADYSAMVVAIRSEEYYVNMMRAWYFAEALTRQYDSVVLFLEKGMLDLWTHNKAIQKARESNRISNQKKEYLNSLKRF